MVKDKKVDKQSPISSGLRLGQKLKQYIYIVQAKSETTRCKIGITNDLKRRLKEYNSMTGKSKDNIYTYLFSCEVKDMNQLETDIKTEFQRMREVRNKEIYFYNDDLFEDYTKYIKSHKLFIKEKEIDKQSRLISSVELERSTLTLLLNCSGLAPLQLRVGVL